jgi:hypothetical protein
MLDEFDDRGLAWVTVLTESYDGPARYESARDFAEQNLLIHPALADEDALLARQGVIQNPTDIVIGPDLTIVNVTEGVLNSQIISNLLDQHGPETP